MWRGVFWLVALGRSAGFLHAAIRESALGEYSKLANPCHLWTSDVVTGNFNRAVSIIRMWILFYFIRFDSIRQAMLARIQGIMGPFPMWMLEEGEEAHKYFTPTGCIYLRVEDDSGKTIASYAVTRQR